MWHEKLTFFLSFALPLHLNTNQQDPRKFDRKLRECVDELSEAMRGSLQLDEKLVDFVLGLLTVDPEKR